MRRYALVLLLVLLLPRASSAEEPPKDPEAFLSEARKVHLDLTAKGLKSFTAEMVLRRSVDANLRRYKHLAGFGYSWTTPKPGEFDFSKTHEKLRKGLRDTLRDLWRDVSGTLWFDVYAKAEALRLEVVDANTVVTADLEKGLVLGAIFETGTLKLTGLEVASAKAKVKITHDRVEGAYRVYWRELTVNGEVAYQLRYGAHRSVSGYQLPTVLRLVTKANTTEYRVRYLTVNGRRAEMPPPTEKAVKTLVAAFDAGWRKWSDWERGSKIAEISNTDHDLVSAIIARRGLKDRSPEVRVAAAESLGVMARPNVVPALIAAMKKTEKEIDVYLRVIEALGEIGDPRAVGILSKDWWNQRIDAYAVAAAKAKIHALGNIRDVAAVDALIDTFFVMKKESIDKIQTDLIVALMKLTRQDFRHDRRAWKDWWKKNRNKHRFE